MKHVVLMVIVALAFIGCDPVKNLNWDRTAKDQRLRIGNQVKVDGVIYGLLIYEFKKANNPENISVKKIGEQNWICGFTTLIIPLMTSIRMLRLGL